MQKSAHDRPPRFAHGRRTDTSRLFILAFSSYFQRVCRLQRERTAGDIDLAIIGGAAALAAIERLMRDTTLRQEFADINTVIGDRQHGINALSIAAATGLARETVRRKMNRLAEMGILARRDDGNYVFQPGVLQTEPHRQMFEEWTAATLRFLNDCLELGFFEVEETPP